MTGARPDLVLAFGFGSPWLLGGLFLAGIPIVIHLLHKRRYVEAPWAAMRFLLEATRKQSRRLRLENLILLIVRTVLLILLVLCLARPEFDAESSTLQVEQPVHRVLVIDATFSMQYEESGSEGDGIADERSARTRFDLAREAARGILDDARRGDAWNLVRIADVEPLAIVQEPGFDADRIRREVDDLAVTDSAGRLVPVLDAVHSLVSKLPDLSRKEVTILTDLQASMWTPESAEQRRQVGESIKRIGSKAKLSFVNVSRSVSLNAAVISLQTDARVATVGQTIHFQSLVENSGSVPLRGQVVELHVDDRLVNTKQVDLLPGVPLPVDWTHEFRTAGDHSVEVRLQEDSLSLDNRRWLTIPVREEIRVLLVDGQPATDRRRSGTFFIRQALSPETRDQSATGTIRPQVIGENELPSQNLSRFDVVALCNVGLLTDREATLLESFVRSGGGLLIFPGDQTNADSFNLRLHQSGKGILPARFLESVAADEDKPFLFDARGFEHPAVRAFRGNPGAGLESTMTFRFLKFGDVDEARPIVWFTDGSPAVLEKQTGSGFVIQAATSIDDQWGTWAIWAPGFVPMMHELVLFSISGQSRNRQLAVGRPIVVSFPSRMFDMSVTVTDPVGDVRPLSLSDSNELVSGVFETTHTAGVYAVELGSPLNREERYSVNVDPKESQLAVASREVVESDLLSDVNAVMRTAEDGLADSGRQEVRSSLSRLSRILAWSVLALLLVEPVLAWRFGWGAVGLAAIGTAFALMPVFGTIAAGLATAIVVAGGIVLTRAQGRRRGLVSDQNIRL